ncbi:MAG: ABC transporter permease, partial [Promethearchaeota archaeon]
MGVILKLAIRNMKRRKARYILTSLTLVIGVALFGGILIANDSFQVTFVNDIDRRMGTADILLRDTENADGWFNPNDLKDVKDLDHVTDIAYRISGFNIQVTAVEGGSLDDNSTSSAIYGIDPDSKGEQHLGGPPTILDSKVDGNSLEDLLKDASSDEIVITESLKIKLGKDFEAGDTIYIFPIDYEKTFPTGEQELVKTDSSLWPKYKVLAIIRDNGEARDFDPDTPEQFSSPSRGPCIFTTLGTAHDLVDGLNDYDDKVTLAAIGVDDLNLIKDVIKEIDHDLDNDKWVAADLKSDSVDQINSSMTMLRTMFLMFALVALILSIILIMNIFNIIKEEQEYETGMLQAIGSSKSETFKMFLYQGIIMGIIGAIIGTIGSYFMSYFIFWLTIESLRNLPGGVGEYFQGFEFGIVLYPQTIIVTLAVGIISCILASIYPSWKASRKPIIECLNPLAQKAEREKKHFKRKILVGIMALLLIAIGSYLLFTLSRFGPERSEEASTISMIAPTMILLGIIGLMNLFVSPLTRVFVKIFSPYLKHTTLLTGKNVLRHRKRTVLTFSMISLTTSYLIGLSVFLGSIEAGVQTTVNDVMGCDVRIICYGTPLEFGNKLEDRKGVDEVMGVTYENIQIWDGHKWVGHRQLEKEWDVSITANVVEPKMMKKHMNETVVLDPSSKPFEKLITDLSDENTVMIPKETADKFDLKKGDTVLVRFSLGVDYPSATALRDHDVDNAVEITCNVKLKVIAIVDDVQGFGFSNLIGQDVESYSIFISWNTWDSISLNNLNGGGTDLMFRHKSQSGEPGIDNFQSKWFNFSEVIGAIENVSNIDYYTTRMDYFSPTYGAEVLFNPFDPAINFESSVVGIRTNSSGKLVDDSYFGQNTLIDKSDEYSGSTMEQLLNNTKMVCVVDESYANLMKESDSSFGIGSNITIFPQEFQSMQYQIFANSLYTSVTTTNGSSTGLVDFLTLPAPIEPNNMTFTSNKTSMEVIIDFDMTYFMTHYINPHNISITSFLNASVDNLELDVLNYYTGKYDKLGDLNNTDYLPYDFEFNQEMPAFSYINLSNFIMRLRIKGYNSTYGSDYRLDLDYLNLLVDNSTYTLYAPSWPKYQVIGIIKDPSLAKSERAFWSSASERYYDVEQTTNTVYINYENARNYVYLMNRGSLPNGTYDKITSVLIHSNSIEDINSVHTQLKQELNNVEANVWTVLDLKTQTLESRRYAFDWYIWIKNGYDDEQVLEDLTQYIQDQGYLVLFGFTRSFVEDMFTGMINLITMITTGVLTFAIIIAMIGLALHSLLSTMSRRREIGMLRSIGLNKKGVIRTVSGETIIISLLGAAIGILAGLLQGFLMVSAVPDTGLLTVTFTIPWLTIGILVGVTIATAIISSRYPSRWAANINIIDAV